MVISTSKKSLRANLSLVLGITATTLLVGCGGSETKTNPENIDPSQPVSDWEMVWNDEFDGDAINTQNWSHEVNCDGGGNQEQQCYTDSSENSYVKDGILNIVALPSDDADLPYTSARLTTQYKGDFKYGRIEMSAKMPSGQGSWPAFWMMPTDSVYGGWPRSGEIDIVETVNLKAAREDGSEEAYLYGTLHYGKSWPDNVHSGQSTMLTDGANPADGFHTYAIEWQEGEIRWYVDNYLYATQRKSEVAYNSNGDAYKLNHKGWFTEYYNQETGEIETHWDNAPYDQDFFLILNYAVGGDWPTNVNELGIDADAFGPDNKFEIDYVRVYQCMSDPETGKGCETVRPGYDDLEDALVEGKAPVPVPPQVVIETFHILSGGQLLDNWYAWDCCGAVNELPLVEDEERGQVARFTIDNDFPYEWGGTVFGFNTEGSAEPSPIDATALIDLDGMLTFDMKLLKAPEWGDISEADRKWIVKIKSINTEVEFDLATTSLEGLEGITPTVGDWQTFTLPLTELAKGNGTAFDLSGISIVMIFPTWGSQTADFLVSNMDIIAEIPSPELVLFEDAENPSWPLWGDTEALTEVTTDDEEHGAVARVTIPASQTVMGFNGRDAGSTFDASGIATNGIIQFDMKVISLPDDSAASWYLKLESTTSTAADATLDTSIEGLAPAVGDWQTYSFKLSDFEANGLDLSSINIFMIFPDWGANAGADYLLDNVKIFDPTASDSVNVVFDNALSEEWTLFNDAGPAATIEDSGDEHASVIQYTIDENPTVMGLDARPNSASVDASNIESVGVIRFDLKVITAPANTNEWFFKVESSSNKVGKDFQLNESMEGQDPTEQWQTFTFPLQGFVDAGIDASAIDVLMIFPAWGAGEGAVYQVDNFMILDPAALPMASK